MLGMSKNVDHYVAQLDDTPWLTVLGYAWGAFSIIVLMVLVAPATWRPTIKMVGLALPLLFFVAKDLAQIPRVLVAMHNLRGQRAGVLRYVLTWLPPALIGAARLDRALWGNFLKWARRQPTPLRPAGIRLSYHERGAYPTVVALGLFSVLVELPIGEAILPLLIANSSATKAIHLLSALSAAYSLVWLLGDRWSVRHGYHVLTDSHLDLHVGARAKAYIPLAVIEDISPLHESMDEWRAKRSLRHAETVNITPFDKPNLVVRLSPEADCMIYHHGLDRNGTRYVFLYLDHPGQLVSAFASKL